MAEINGKPIQKVKVVCPSGLIHDCKVSIDGLEIENCVELQINANVHGSQMVEVTLKLINVDLEIEGGLSADSDLPDGQEVMLKSGRKVPPAIY